MVLRPLQCDGHGAMSMMRRFVHSIHTDPEEYSMLPVNSLLQGRYQIIAQIGRGGMGAVYKAIDTRLRSTIALKQTLVEGDIARRAFEREAQLLASMRHPALPRVSDHFTDENGQFLVMEFIPGDDLGAMIVKHGMPFPTSDVLNWGDRLLDALEYLHGHNPPIVHRDIKPQNMKLTDRGEIILLDFGLAKGSTAQATRSASTGSIYGYTPHYAPLEQIQGTGTGPRSDLYALAATMHHLLTGSPPPDALTRAAARINDEPDPLQPANELNPEVPAAVAAVLMQTLSQKPDQRPDSATSMRAMLRAAAQGAAPTVAFRNPSSTQPNTPPVVMVSSPSTPATQSAQVANTGPTITPVATGTTVLHSSTVAPPVTKRPGWLMPVLGVGAVVIAVLVTMLVLRPPDRLERPELPPPPSPTALNVAAASTQAPTLDAIAAARATVLAEQTATVGAATAEADRIAAAIAANDANRTAVAEATLAVASNTEKTALAETAAVIALTPTETIPPPTDLPAPTAVPVPSDTPRPAATRDPNAQPTATRTPRPTDTPQPATVPPAPAGRAAVLAAGGGSEFSASANVGEIAPEQGQGGSCIEGSVKDQQGNPFPTILVGIDKGGNTRSVPSNTSNFRVCGLDAGEWGVVVFKAGGKDVSPADQGAHQVRVRLTGTPGEIVYINFRAGTFEVPQPTPTPPPGPYDGEWSGTISGKTAGDVDFNGRFRMEIRENKVYRISIDGPSCAFETYPNAGINGNNFGTSGSPTNPQTGTNNSIQYNISGSFSSTSKASGQINATENGGMCITANWSVSR